MSIVHRLDDGARRVACHLATRLRILSPKAETVLIGAGSIALSLFLLSLLVTPGRTVTYQYAHDLMIFLDGSDRVIDGQLPNLDFHTPLGLLAYFLPALGFWVAGSAGGMMPTATAFFALSILPMAIYAASTRLPLVYAGIFTVFLITLVVTPASVGETAPTFAMFYNRWGYALLAIEMLLILPRVRWKESTVSDSLVLSAVLLITFYLKISYFAVALVYAAAMLIPQRSRRAAGTAFIATAAGIGLFELIWGGTAAYFADISMAARSSGILRSPIFSVLGIAVRNIGMTLPFMFILVIAVLRKAPPPALLASLYMAGAGILLANQNAQGPGLLTLVPASILLAVSGRETSGTSRGLELATLLLVLTLAVPQIFSSTEGTLRHASMALAGRQASGGDVADIDGFIAYEPLQPVAGAPSFDAVRTGYRTGVFDLDTVASLRALPLRQTLGQPEYLRTLRDAVHLLGSDPRLQGSVFTLDMTNPLNALTGRSAPRGVESWYHLARTFSETSYRDAPSTFREVDVVLVPKAPVEPNGYWVLKRIYGSYIDEKFELVASSDYWLAYAKRAASKAGS